MLALASASVVSLPRAQDPAPNPSPPEEEPEERPEERPPVPGEPPVPPARPRPTARPTPPPLSEEEAAVRERRKRQRVESKPAESKPGEAAPQSPAAQTPPADPARAPQDAKSQDAKPPDAKPKERGSDKPDEPVPERTTLSGKIPDEAEWRALVERDVRVRFSQRSAADARLLLGLEKVPIDKRAAALLVLGAAGEVNERLKLESLAKHSTGMERRAALLSLGELASSSEAFLTSFVSEPEVGECALLALLRSGRPAARRRVEEIASDPGHKLHDSARELLVFDVDRAASRATAAATLLLELRWVGARTFGLVDGQSWRSLQVARWIADPTFVRDIVLRGTRRLYRPGVKDHLLQILLHGEGLERVDAAVRAMPLEVQELVRNELWLPTETDWPVILAAIEEKSLESITTGLLERAAAIDRYHYRAAIMLARANTVDVSRYIDDNLSRVSVDDRVDACDAMATSRDTSWRAKLEELEQSLEPRVRVAALVARMRLGSRAAEERVRVTLHDPDDVDHARMVEILLRCSHDAYSATLLEDYLTIAPEEESLELAVNLCRRGRLAARSRVREALAAEPPPSDEEVLRLLTALARRPGPEDLELLRTLFPLEDRREANVEIASALLELGDREMMPAVRAGMWKSELDLSLLAAAVMADIGGGVRRVRWELNMPPADVSSNDLRRVGFAVGEWGGLYEVEELAKDLRYASGHPALQGAYLGLLATRTQ